MNTREIASQFFELTSTLGVGAGMAAPLGMVSPSNHKAKKRKCGTCKDPSKCHCPNVKAEELEDQIQEWALRMSPLLIQLRSLQETLDPNLAELVKIHREMCQHLE